jgi:hypothetical protein
MEFEYSLDHTDVLVLELWIIELDSYFAVPLHVEIVSVFVLALLLHFAYGFVNHKVSSTHLCELLQPQQL